MTLSPAPDKGPDTPSHEAGFSLIELLVVLVIMALLAALVGPRVAGYLGQSKVKAAEVQIASLRTALELYRLDLGTYPGTEEGLAALSAPPSGLKAWNGPYLGKPVGDDPWGHPYAYQQSRNGDGFSLVSLGADGRPGGEGENADIGS